MTTAVSAAPRAERSTLERVLAAYPLAAAYLFLLTLYAWQSTKHPTPWVFTDELQWAGLSQGVAHHGQPELRLRPQSFSSLYEYYLAPAWWLGSTGRAYAAAKYLNAIAMTATLFPAYGLGRLFLPRRAAFVAAVAAAAIPSVAYAGMLIPESLAYPWSTLALWLLARALLRPSRSAVVLAGLAVVSAPAVKSELEVLIAGALIAWAIMAATGPRGRALIGSWSRGERIGALTVAVGILILLGALANHHSYTWEIGAYYKHRMLTYGLWAVGAFAIGVGVLPVLASLMWLLGSHFRSPDERALAATFASSIVVFGLYTAVKASYVSTNFAIRVEERNLIYLSPLVFVATARWFVSGRSRLVPLLLATGAVAYLLATTPLHNNEHFYSDAPGYSVLQWLNRTWRFTTADAQHLLYGILIGTVVVALGRELLRGRAGGRLALAGSAALAALVVAWNLTGEITAADASNSFAKSFRATLPTPPDWIDRATGRERTMFIGEALSGSNAFWSLEFWNQSIQDVWSVDASAPGPGPVTTPNYLDTAGTLDPQLPLEWIVAGPGVDPVGRLAEKPVDGLRLYRVSHPIRLADAYGGITPDGWMETSSWYYRFTSAGTEPGYAVIGIGRSGACGAIRPSHVTIRLSRLEIDADGQPVAGRLLAVRHVVVRSDPCGSQQIRIPARAPYRLDLTAVGTFQPSAADTRQLSAQVTFGFEPRR